MRLANALRTVRAEQGVTQLALALAMGASSTTYLSKLENGRRLNPGRSFLCRYITAFSLLGCPLRADQQAALLGALVPLPNAA